MVFALSTPNVMPLRTMAPPRMLARDSLSSGIGWLVETDVESVVEIGAGVEESCGRGTCGTRGGGRGVRRSRLGSEELVSDYSAILSATRL